MEKLISDEVYEKYRNKVRRIDNEVLRKEGQTFGQAMAAGSIVEGLPESLGKEILEFIKDAGKKND